MLILATEGQILTLAEPWGEIPQPALPLREQELGASSNMDHRAPAARRQG